MDPDLDDVDSIEDDPEEQYFNTCCDCLRMFVGYKRRNICRVCATEKLPEFEQHLSESELENRGGAAYVKTLIHMCATNHRFGQDQKRNKLDLLAAIDSVDALVTLHEKIGARRALQVETAAAQRRNVDESDS